MALLLVSFILTKNAMPNSFRVPILKGTCKIIIFGHQRYDLIFGCFFLFYFKMTADVLILTLQYIIMTKEYKSVETPFSHDNWEILI